MLKSKTNKKDKKEKKDTSIRERFEYSENDEEEE